LLTLVACHTKVRNPSVTQQSGDTKQIMLALGWENYDRIGFDPTLGWGFGNYGPPLFQSTLLRRNENYELVGDLAENYTISSDRQVWKFKLREDVYFCDGHPLKASDVAYTFNTTKLNATTVDLTNLESAVATGDYEVELRLKKPEITFVNRITALGIVPEHAHNRDYARNPIGSGPYKLLQWNEGEQIVIAARPDYYGQPPNIKRLVFLLTREDAALAAARSGQVQLANVPPSVVKAPPENMEIYAVRNQWHTGITLPYVPNTGQQTPKGDPIGNNVTADLAIRQAMHYAIDRQLLIEGLLNGFGSPAMSPVSNGAPWQEPTAEISDADLQTARNILASGGWHDSNGDGIVEKQGIKAEFTLIYPAQDRLRQGFVLAVVQMLEPVGIKVNVEGKSWDYIERQMHSNSVIYVIRPSDPKTLQDIYYSALAQQAWSNPSYYANPLVDQAIESAMTSTSEAQANVFWRKVQWDGQTGVTAKGDAAFLSLVNIDSTYLVNNCLDLGKPKNQSLRYDGTILDNITAWRWVCE
jgi:peptide/nickel transport system substrate-binding protein